jgi:hypothetical protein
VARCHCLCGGFGWPFLVRGYGMEAARVDPHQGSIQQEIPLNLESIVAGSNKLSREVGG